MVERALEALVLGVGIDVVRGNHDRWAVAGRGLEPATYTPGALAWLATLPPTRSYDTPLGPLLLGHGLGADDMARLQPDDTGYALESNTSLHTLISDGRHRVFVGGHTHRAMVRAFGTLVVINAGTLLRSHDPCCTVLDLERRELEVLDVGDDGVKLRARRTL